MGMLPGMANVLPPSSDKESQARLKRMLCILDSLTPKELDHTTSQMISERSRIERWARGSGTSVPEVEMLVAEYKKLKDTFGKMKMPKGGMQKLGSDPRAAQKMAQMLGSNPQMAAMAKQLSQKGGGMQGMQQMMQQMMKGGGMGGPAGLDMAAMMKQLQGMGGAGRGKM